MGKRSILVVDDERDMQIFVSTVVETLGHEPTVAGDGSTALESAKKQKPDLVILDVMMPGIEDGVQTYQHFRTDRDLASIPIIMLSAIARKTFFHTIRVLHPQNDAQLPEPEAYMEKPPDATELADLITRLLEGNG